MPESTGRKTRLQRAGTSPFRVGRAGSRATSQGKPIRRLRMLAIPQRPAAAHLWKLFEILKQGRRGRGPLERPGVPGIVARYRSEIETHRDIRKEQENAEHENAGSDGRNNVQRAKPREIRIGEDATPHP